MRSKTQTIVMFWNVNYFLKLELNDLFYEALENGFAFQPVLTQVLIYLIMGVTMFLLNSLGSKKRPFYSMAIHLIQMNLPHCPIWLFNTWLILFNKSLPL